MSKFGHEPGSSYLHSTVSRRLYSTRFSLDQSQGRTPLYHRPSTGEGDVSRPAETDGETTAPANTAINHSPHVALLAGRSGVRRHRRGRRAGTRVQARRRYAIDEERRLNHRSELIPLTGPESAYGYPPPTAMDAPPTPSAEGTAGCIVPDERLAVPSSNENS